mmetsp:Transcript_4121/g.9889  ORF Transcript_4121/g.9889 Transcript_4121/m.9889 type:complete len:257 (+) Transcript_4121:393-1163(+)
MTTKRLTTVWLHIITGLIHLNSIIHTLKSNMSTIRRQCRRWHAVHVGLRYVFYRYRNTKFPHQHFFIVTRRHKTTTLVEEGDAINALQMLVVLLHLLTAAHVPLQHCVLVRTSKQRIGVGRVKTNTVRRVTSIEARRARARLRVPQLHATIVASGSEVLAAVGRKLDRAHALVVTEVRSHTRSRNAVLAVHAEQLARSIHRSRQQQMTINRKKSNLRNGTRVSRQRTPHALRQVARVLARLDVRGWVHVGAALVIV